MQKKPKIVYVIIAVMLCLAVLSSVFNVDRKPGRINEVHAVFANIALQAHERGKSSTMFYKSSYIAMFYEDSCVAMPYKDNFSAVVWLDAGHGGVDVGTYVTLDESGTRVYEKDITLAIVLKVYKLFAHSNSNVRIFLTRADDIYIHRHDRPLLWNYTEYMVAKADLVVSVHVDFYEGRTAQYVSGIQVNYYQNNLSNTGRINITGETFAQILQDHLINETGARDRSIRGDRRFVIPTYSTMPAVVIEAGFMSNDEELLKLQTAEYRMAIATAIYNGIVDAVRLGVYK